ncbi:GNAT family N-acetyltransferase [Xanthobacter autotrophicus]|uniref:GNAT family N-acetyltransferase n=1 Tax=Xanthobacter autotrophicus TaxID=280 RepID=UPI003726B031
MWPLSSVLMIEPLPVIEGNGIYLRLPQMKDFGPWRDLREESRSFLTPWEPLWPADDLTRGAFRRRLRRYTRDMVADEAYPLFIFRQSDHALVGGLTLSNVRRGVCQAASLGYWMGEAFAGQGYMKAAVTALLPVAYDMLHLRRIEAACMPTNQPSIRLLEGCGFVREGYSREYLCINGTWEDHILFGRLRHDVPALESARRDALEEVPPAAQ